VSLLELRAHSIHGERHPDIGRDAPFETPVTVELHDAVFIEGLAVWVFDSESAGHEHLRSRHPERSARAVEADDVAAGTLSGDERDALTSAHTPLVDKHRDRPCEVWLPWFGPQSQLILGLEPRCGFVVVGRVPVELTLVDEEALKLFGDGKIPESKRETLTRGVKLTLAAGLIQVKDDDEK